MADYGLKIFDSGGNVKLDTTDTLTRLRYSNIVSAGASSSTTLADIDGKSTCQFGMVLESSKTPHRVDRSGTTITWTATGSTFWPSGNTLILVFLYT